MKRVAFLSFDWDYKVVSEYYLGLQEHLQGAKDVQVVIFNAYGHYYASHVPKESSFEIFSLFDPGDFDGVLVQGNRSWPPELRQQVVNRALELRKPVVSINYDLQGAHSVGTDNCKEEYELVCRVLKDRKCRRPAFVNGLKTSVEAQDRLRGYRKACARFGIRDGRFYQANWQRSAGVATAQKLLRKPNDLPDVVFCCNDDLAVGVQETLLEAGVRVPQDVMVTGFDNREIGQRATPRITTVDRDYRTAAVTALNTLLRLIEGKDVPARVFSPAQHILAESCGYSVGSDADRISALNTSASSLDHVHEVLSNYQSSILSSDSLYALLENCEMFARQLDCPNAFLLLNDAFLRLGIHGEAKAYGPLCRLVARKGSAVTLRCDDRHVYTSYATRRILPPEVPFDRPLYMVSPLRHNETCVGMVVTEGVPSIVRYGFNAFFLTPLASALSSVKKNELLQEASERLDELGVRDELTGLYNQRTFGSLGRAAQQRLLQSCGEAHLVTVDVQNMDEILVAHNREAGDCALRDTADIIRAATRGEDVFAMRSGTSEFLVIGRRDLTAALAAELRIFRGNVSRPYDLRLRFGVRTLGT